MAASSSPLAAQSTRLSLVGAVARFKALVEPNLVQNGQFVWSVHYQNELTKIVNAALANDAVLKTRWGNTNLQNVPPGTVQTGGVLSTLLRVVTSPVVISPSKFNSLLVEVLNLQAGLNSQSAGITKSLLTLPGTPGQPDAGTAIHNEATKLLKSGTIVAPTVPGTTVTPGNTAFQTIFAPSRLTFKGAYAIGTLSQSRCFETTNAVCRFLKAIGGFNGKPKALDASSNPGQVFGSIVKRPPPLNDLLTFSSALPGAIKKARRALDQGHVLNTGVVSGITLGNTLASPDHFVPIIAYEEFLAPIPVVAFAFWDPDVTSSTLLGPGFGELFFLDAATAENEHRTGPNATTIPPGFYANGRLTSALKDIDLQCTGPAGRDSRNQHRYQATVLDGQLRL